MLVKYNKLNTLSFGTVMLLPGVNRLNAEQTKAFLEAVGDPEKGKKPLFPKLAFLVEQADLEVVTEPKVTARGKEVVVDEDEGAKGSNELAELKPAQAVKLVKETVDEKLLKDWLESEERKTVVAALEAQLDKLAKTNLTDEETKKQNDKDGTGEG